MPIPPDFETDVRVYLYLRDQASVDGIVSKSLREMAPELGFSGNSWSNVRFHFLHLKDAGLIDWSEKSGGPKPKSIVIKDMDLDDTEAIYESITSVPRRSWDKRRQQEEMHGSNGESLDEVARVQVDAGEGLRTVGLSFLFLQMTAEFRDEVVRQALDSRDEVSAGAKDSLDGLINKYIVVDGFRSRSAARAPVPMMLHKIAEEVRKRDDLAGVALRVWQEGQAELRERLAVHLENRGVAIVELDFAEGRIGVGSGPHTVISAVESFMDEQPEENQDVVTLLAHLLTGTVLLPIEGEEEEEAGTGQVSSLLEAALDALQSLPRDAEEWTHIIPGFSGMVADIIEEQKIATEQSISLDNLLDEICGQYGELLEFFELETRHWFAANLSGGPAHNFRVVEDLWGERRWFPPGERPGFDFQRVYDLAVELQGLLSQYAPIHERAAVALEEMVRAEERMELLPAILKVGESLGGMMTVGNGGPTREIPAAGPSSDPTPDGEVSPPASSGDGEAFHEVPACQIEDYLLMRLEIQELDKENDDLERQVETLKEQLYETRSVGEGLRLALAYKEDGSVEEVEFPILEYVKAAVELATERFRDRLLFQCNSESTIEDNPFKWPEQVWKALEWLATSYYDSRIGLATNPDLDVSCREASGMWYKTSQHDNTMALYRNAYTTRVNGRIIWLGEHIGKGTGFDPRRTIRIGFDWDRTLQKVIIGYIGRHQTTSAS